MTLFITHSACFEHLTLPGHPERPDRLRAIEQALEHEKFTLLVREQCPRAELEIVALCHPWEHIEQIRRAVPQIGLVQLDDDTVLSAGSFEASCCGWRNPCGGRDHVWKGKKRVRRDPPRRPSCRIHHCHGILPFQQCSHCGLLFGNRKLVEQARSIFLGRVQDKGLREISQD